MDSDALADWLGLEESDVDCLELCETEIDALMDSLVDVEVDWLVEVLADVDSDSVLEP
ncbi:hypothetical protein [Lacticaseibacillus zeae]|uniref:hypothetical protein n=1 Tax=Lacticaseibacillus zeae TaxID=57037 RepID=UPI001E420953|nr:hypothetical protein [Lacticaseibacillus zeae]